MTEWAPTKGGGLSFRPGRPAEGDGAAPAAVTRPVSGLSVLEAAGSRTDPTKQGALQRREHDNGQTPQGTNSGGSVCTGTSIGGLARHEYDCLWEEVACAHGSEEPITESLSAHRLLTACAAEARQLALEALALDATVAEAMSNSAQSRAGASLTALLTASLQGLDLFCQEIDGLGRVLALVAEEADFDGTISGEKFTAAVKLGAQRRRLLLESTLDRHR